MVDQVVSELFSTAEFRQQTQLGPKLVQSPIVLAQTQSYNCQAC